MNTIQSNEASLREILTRLGSKGKPESRYDEGQEDAMSTILNETPRELLIQSCLQPTEFLLYAPMESYFATDESWDQTPFGEYDTTGGFSIELDILSNRINVYGTTNEMFNPSLEAHLLLFISVRIGSGIADYEQYTREVKLKPSSGRKHLDTLYFNSTGHLDSIVRVDGIKFTLLEE